MEHVLASLSWLGATNAIVEAANEPPIADGSSRQFCRMINEAGIETQAEIEPITIIEPIEYTHGETVMNAFPFDGLKITCTSSTRAAATQFFSVELTPKTWSARSPRADVLLLRGDRVSDQERSDPRWQPRERHRHP